MATTALEVEIELERVRNEHGNGEGEKADVLNFRDEKMRRIREAASRNGIAAKFDGVVFVCTRGEARARQKDAERARRAVQAESKARASEACKCGEPVFARCEGKKDAGPLYPADPDCEARKTSVCREPVCAACARVSDRHYYCAACMQVEQKKMEEEAVDLDELCSAAVADEVQLPLEDF